MVVDTRTRAGRVAGVLGILTLMVGTLAACAGQSATSASPSVAPASPSGSASTEPSASAASPSASAGAVTDVPIEAKDFSYVAPASIEAGVTKVTVNNTGKEEHQAQLARIADGKTFADLTAALQQPDEAAALAMLTLAGGPTGVAPGVTASTTANLEPGQYAFLCFVSGADGIPHLAKGMIAPMEVTGTAVDAPLPAGDAELALQDFAFVGLSTLTPGQHTVTVENKGPQPHEATLVKLNEGTTIEQIVEAFGSSETSSAPPPWTSAGGIAGISAGSTATMDIDVEAGNYAFICFVPDPATGAPHAALGMIGGLTVQ